VGLGIDGKPALAGGSGHGVGAEFGPPVPVAPAHRAAYRFSVVDISKINRTG
jgi:hypothetical protein